MKPKLKTLEKFYTKLASFENDRFRSFDHCYLFFHKLKKSNKKLEKKELAMLHLGFYLASWGMYRGSSFVLQKDYKIYDEIVDIVLDKKYDELWEIERSLKLENVEKYTDLCWKLHLDISDFLEKQRDEYYRFISKQVRADISSVLTTKIILGTVGCIPAYDRFFKDGIRHYNALNKFKLIMKFSKNSIKKILLFMVENKAELLEIQKRLKKKTGVKYPLMKLIDSYFWQIGFLLEIQKRLKKKTGVKYPLMKLIDSYFWQIGFDLGGKK